MEKQIRGSGIRLPKGFEAEIHLKVLASQAGSTAVPLFREVPDTPEPHLMSFDDELDEAALGFGRCYSAAGEHEGVPSDLPRRVIPLFEDLGKTLHEDEYLLLAAGKLKAPALMTAK